MANANEQTLVKQITGVDYDFPTATDLSALQYQFVESDADELVTVLTAGHNPTGILQNAPLGTSAAHAWATVRILGGSKLRLSGTVVTTLPFIKGDTNGTGIAVTANKDNYGAVAKSGGVSGDVILVVVNNGIYNA